LIEYRDVTPPTASAAKPLPVVTGALFAGALMPGRMSNPLTDVKSSGLPFSVTVVPRVCVPALGGFWM
jgi:hypothetical protein